MKCVPNPSENPSMLLSPLICRGVYEVEEELLGLNKELSNQFKFLQYNYWKIKWLELLCSPLKLKNVLKNREDYKAYVKTKHRIGN